MQRVSCGGAENTTAQLSVCTSKEQRMVIHFLWAEGVNKIEIHIHLFICNTFTECVWVDGYIYLRKAGLG
jgi:hypothetical protein